MEISQFKEELRKLYINRDVDAVIRTIKDYMQAPEFSSFFNQLCNEHKIASASAKLEEIASVLIGDVENSLKDNSDKFANVTYLDISAELEKQFGAELSNIYISTKMPSEFLLKVRAGYKQRDVEKLSDDLVKQYRDELIRIEKGRQVVSAVLQKYSNFPLKHATTSSRLIERLAREIKSNYKYLTIKPYLMAVFACGEPEEQDSTIRMKDSEDDEQVLFKHYLNTGIEPTILQQLKFRLAVNSLFRHIKEHDVLLDDNFRAYVKIISRIWGYRCPSKLTQNARAILEDLMLLVNHDQQAILKKLALTFIDEYRHAEDRMKLYHNGIQSELAITKEYLSQLAEDTSMINSEDKENIRIAQEKIIGLDGVFEISPALQKAAAGKQFLELERTSLGLSTSVGVERLTDWIRIYSILYSNSEFLEYTDQEVDFTTMRKYISDLSTYHLILNIAQLKEVIDQSLTSSDDEKVSQFTMFNEALKLRLQNLMVKSEEEKSLREMIDDLGFLGNQSLQFVIAETFEGFQKIADAFTDSATDYFIHDKEALLKESNDLYRQICNQCMKNFLVRPVRHSNNEKGPVEHQKKGWLRNLFS